MSNVESVQQIYAAFGRGDIPTVLAALADGIVWDLEGPASVPFYGHREGKARVAEFFQAVGSQIDFEEFGPREFVAQGDKVIALGFEKGKARPTGKSFQCHWAHVFTFKDGQIVQFREYNDSYAYAEAFRKG